jgi:hypothetical protein
MIRRSQWMKSSLRLLGDGRGWVLDAMQTILHMLLCGQAVAVHCFHPNSTHDACESNDWLFIAEASTSLGCIH